MSEKKFGKRLLTWVLVIVMMLTLLPLNVLAENKGKGPNLDYNGGKSSLQAEYFCTNQRVAATQAISFKDDKPIYVQNIAPQVAGYTFWKAVVLPNGSHQWAAENKVYSADCNHSSGSCGDKTDHSSDGIIIDAIEKISIGENRGIRYYKSASSTSTRFYSNDQLVFYYKQNYVEDSTHGNLAGVDWGNPSEANTSNPKYDIFGLRTMDGAPIGTDRTLYFNGGSGTISGIEAMLKAGYVVKKVTIEKGSTNSWTTIETYGENGRNLQSSYTLKRDANYRILFYIGEEDNWTVTYEWKGLPEGSGLSVPTDPNSYSKGNNRVTLDNQYTNRSLYTKDGVTYHFSGWFLDSEHTKAADSSFTITHSTTLYGYWESPVVIIDLNGEAGGTALINKSLTVDSTSTLNNATSFSVKVTPQDVAAKTVLSESGITGITSSMSTTDTVAFTFAEGSNKLVFASAGTYTFNVQETDGGVENMTYDKTPHAMTIVVTPTDDQMNLTAAVSFDSSLPTLTIYNSYTEPKITGYSKSIVTDPQTASNAGARYPVNGTVTVPNGTPSVTLLYKISVTGTTGAQATVTDADATLVNTRSDNDDVTVTTNSDGSWKVTFTNGGTVDLYVKKTFTKGSEGWSTVTNVATVNGQNTDPVITEIKEAEEENPPQPTTTTVNYFFKTVNTNGDNVKAVGVEYNGYSKRTDGAFGWWATAGSYATDKTLEKGNVYTDTQTLADVMSGSFTADPSNPTFNTALIQPYELKYMSNDASWHLDGTVTAYSVTYNANAGSDTVSNLPTDSNYYLSGTNYNVSTDVPTREGYTFDGWNLGDKEVGETVSIDNQNITLVAQWIENDPTPPSSNTVTVTYRVVNGTWDDSSTEDKVFVLTLTDDGSAALGDTIPTGMIAANDGYEENGEWNEAINANTEIMENTVYTYTFAPIELPPTRGTVNLGNYIYKTFLSRYGYTSPSTYTFTATATIEKLEAINTAPPATANTLPVEDLEQPVVNPDEINETEPAPDSEVMEEPTDAAPAEEPTTDEIFVEVASVQMDSILESLNPLYIDPQFTELATSNETYVYYGQRTGYVTLSTGDHAPFKFDPIELEDGIYRITVTENPGADSYVTYDPIAYTFILTMQGGKPTVDRTVTITNYYTYYYIPYYPPYVPPTVEIEDDDALGLNTTDHFAYIIGYPDGTVQPGGQITRAEVATIFFRLLTDDVREENFTRINPYSDVAGTAWYNNAVSTLSAMGIITGYPDGTFRPNASITRAEFAAIAARFDNDGDKTAAAFSDIANHWAKDEISVAYNNGWVDGYPDGTFGPQRSITRAETMTLVNRVLNRKPETEDDLLPDMVIWTDNADKKAWYYLAVQEATNSHYYEFKTNSEYEKWTELRENRDWSQLEK